MDANTESRKHFHIVSAIGNGEGAQAHKEVAAIVLGCSANEDFMSLRQSLPDGTWYLTMLTEDRRGWMLFRISSNSS